MYKLFTLILMMFLPFLLSAQMVNGTDTLYGNEWIHFDQQYFKVSLAEDGLYRLSANELMVAGVPIASIQANHFQVFHLGKEVPIFTSTSGNFSNADYITFVGQKNRTALERHLFIEPSNMLNPAYSLFTDTSAYFLTWDNNVDGLRFDIMNNNTTNHPFAEPYFLQKQEKMFADYWAKREFNNGTKFSHFDVAEGFATTLKANQSQSFTPVNPDLSGPQAQLNVRYAGRSLDHHQEIRINNSLVLTDEFNGWNTRVLDFNINASELSSAITFKMKGLANNQNKIDRSRLAYLSLTYPQEFNFEDKSQYAFSLEAKSQYIEITNFDLSQGTPTLYDYANGQRFEGEVIGDLIGFMLPQTTKPKQLVLSAGDKSINLVAPSPVAFIDYASANSNYLMISNRRLYDDGNGHNYVQEYADYRASAEGGNYNPLIVDIQQVYDQFGYGVQRNPIGIRNMAQWAVRHWDNAQYLYLIGKGRTYNDVRSMEKLTQAQSSFFVPTFGSPGGDNLFVTSNFDNTPRLAIGRLAVSTAEEIRIYFNKVKAQEVNQHLVGAQTIEEQAWKKKAIHLGGGSTPGEKNSIKNHLNNMKNTIGASEFCGHTVSFFKDVNDPIQQTVPQQIFNEINSGSALITIFGHSSPGSFDFNIDNPEYYDNNGKFPILASFGCYSGNIFTSQKGISERFCLYEEKGAIGFVASTSVGYISYLGAFGKVYYEQLGKQQTIGEALQAAFGVYKDYALGSDFRRISEQMLLNGDPAIQIGLSEGIDYLIDYNSVSFGSPTVSAREDSISIDFSIVNIGKNYSAPVSIKLKHVKPNGQVFMEKELTFIPNGYHTSFHYSWKNPGATALGQNTFFAELDFAEEINELPQPAAELNNNLESPNGKGISFFISDNSVAPVEPQEFAIKNKNSITLIASTANAFAEEAKYILQLDTTELFNSPLKEETSITQIGGLLKWNPIASWLDNTVYYWRVSPDSISPDLGYLWANSSFITTTDTVEGWNQSHFFQYQKDKFDGLEIKRDKDLVFSENGFFLSLKNKVKETDEHPEFIYNLGTSASSVRPWNFMNSGLSVFVGDRYTGSGWKNPAGGLYGSLNPSASRVFSYPMDTEENRSKLISLLKDEIPDSSYVWVFSVLSDSTQDFHPELWANDSINLDINIFSLLEGEGAKRIRDLETLGSVPYTFMYKKGKGAWKEDIAMTKKDVIYTEVFIPILDQLGEIQSSLIGPAMGWKDIVWQPSNQSFNDVDTLSVWGVNSQLTDTILIEKNVSSLSYSLENVDPIEYPFLLLKYSLKNELTRSASDLDFWKVHFVPLPEMAVNPNAYLDFHADSIDYGDVLSLDVAVENLKAIPMDSILVHLKILDKANNTYSISQKWAPLSGYDVDTLHYQIPTKELSIGIQTMTIEANPSNDQPEYFHGNNFGLKPFYIKGDKENPILDVFFDGIRILDGDLVSSKPEIKMLLNDENKFFLLQDTSLFTVKLIEPNQNISRIYFSNPDVNFQPATDADNKATITFSPIFTQDGAYRLLVAAKDVLGNQSGNIEYKINFEVITKRSISNVLPYPNPFSTSTRFAYTLTGDVAPSIFTIQILNIVGKVIREITQDEIGDLKIGKHLTDYQWDGRDEYGDLLATGTYLYRLIVKEDATESYEHLSTNSDAYFDKSFGKIVILR